MDCFDDNASTLIYLMSCTLQTLTQEFEWCFCLKVCDYVHYFTLMAFVFIQAIFKISFHPQNESRRDFVQDIHNAKGNNYLLSRPR